MYQVMCAQKKTSHLFIQAKKIEWPVKKEWTARDKERTKGWRKRWLNNNSLLKDYSSFKK